MKYLLFGHGGSGNHGCEAIIRSTLKMLEPGSEADVYSADLERDIKHGITKFASFHQLKKRKDSRFWFLLGRCIYKITGNYNFITKISLAEALKTKGSVCMSVGGDNYCNTTPARHASRNLLFSKNNKTVLWGCSVTPSLLQNPKYIEDMKRYDLITARESLTYNALVSAGVTKARLVSDPAFTLEMQAVPLPSLFNERAVVGINISPLIMKYQKGKNILMQNMQILIQYLLDNTGYGIALIPHVRLMNNNDVTPLKQLFDIFKETGRVCLIDEEDKMNCCELKYIISNCKFMVAARTHASIAAYSTCVPTLVLGYSIKSKGIATDIFGTANKYVLPVDQIQQADEVKHAFMWLESKEIEIRKRYAEFMPSYIKKATLAKQYLQEL